MTPYEKQIADDAKWYNAFRDGVWLVVFGVPFLIGLILGAWMF